MHTIQADVAALGPRVQALSPADQSSLMSFVDFLEWKRAEGNDVRAIARINQAVAMGERLRAVRETLGKTEDEAAEVAGVALHTYLQYERRGARRWGTRKMVEYAETWNVSIDWLYEGTGKMFCEGGPPQLPADRNAFETELREAFDALPEHLQGDALAEARLEIARRIIAAPKKKRSRPAPASNLIDFKTAARAREGGAT
jgi:transcriptional regulator with XRE-family HTH domain